MKLIMENWRGFVDENKQISIDPEIFRRKLDSFLKSEGGTQMHFGDGTFEFTVYQDHPKTWQQANQPHRGGSAILSIFKKLGKSGNIEPVTVVVQNMSMPEEEKEPYLLSLKKKMADFGMKRGWNLLGFDFKVGRRGRYSGKTIGAKFEFDSNRGRKENYVTAGELAQLRPFVFLYHVTTRKTACKIKKGGFKPSLASKDDMMFGQGRSYYFIGETMTPPDVIELAFDPMEGGGLVSGGVGGVRTAFVLYPGKINKNFKFYIDTEFIDEDAVWTASHIPASAIVDEIKNTFTDNPDYNCDEL